MHDNNLSRVSLLNNGSVNDNSFANYTNLNSNLITNNKTQQNQLQKEQFEDINSFNYPLLGPPITGKEFQK